MPDVYQPVKIAGGLPNNGSAIVTVDKLGNLKKVDPKINMQNIASVSGILDTRFDNPTYYSA